MTWKIYLQQFIPDNLLKIKFVAKFLDYYKLNFIIIVLFTVKDAVILVNTPVTKNIMSEGKLSYLFFTIKHSSSQSKDVEIRLNQSDRFLIQKLKSKIFFE